MDYTWITTAFLQLKAVETAYQEDWQATKMMLSDKMMAMLGEDKIGRPILTLKLPPDKNALLQAMYPDKIIPGYYMNKVHWSSIYLDVDVSKELIEENIQLSYETLFKTLSKKKQELIQGQ